MHYYKFNCISGEMIDFPLNVEINGETWLRLSYINDNSVKKFIDIKRNELGLVNPPSCTNPGIDEDYFLITDSLAKEGAARFIIHAMQAKANHLLACAQDLDKRLVCANTRFNYMYRNGSNYKQHYSVVVRGTLSTMEQKALIACLSEGEYFIPAQVGLPGEPGVSGFDLNEDDHCWFEFVGMEYSAAAPTLDITVKDLLRSFLEAENNWNAYEIEFDI